MDEFEAKIRAFGLNNLPFDDAESIFNNVCKELSVTKEYEGLELGEGLDD